MTHSPAHEAAGDDGVAVVASAPILETPRLLLREAVLADAPFFLELLNDPSWLENIGDRGVRSSEAAEQYIRDRIWTQYRTYGYGMYVVELKATAVSIGLCGLVKREFLSDPDLGFALLPDFIRWGYACEAAGGLMRHAAKKLAIEHLYAITKRGNERSVRLLERLGFLYKGPFVTPPGEPVELYANT